MVDTAGGGEMEPEEEQRVEKLLVLIRILQNQLLSPVFQETPVGDPCRMGHPFIGYTLFVFFSRFSLGVFKTDFFPSPSFFRRSNEEHTGFPAFGWKQEVEGETDGLFGIRKRSYLETLLI